MLKINRRTILALIVTLFVSCANDRVSESGGDSSQEHVIIRNGAHGKWADSRILVLEEILTIGETEQGSYEFASVASIVVEESGKIYVCDPLDHQVKVYNSNGKHMMTIGSEGRGPGELKGPRKIGIGPKGEISVLEILNRRVSLFNDQGKFLSSFGYEFGGGSGASDMAVDPKNGHIYLAKSIIPGSNQNDSTMFIHEYSRDGTLINSFGEPGERKSENVIRYLGLSFMPDKSLICYRSYPYEMRIYSATGSLKRIIFRDSPIFTEAELMDNEGPQLRIPRVNVAGYLPLKNGIFLMRIDDLGTEVVDQLRRKIEAYKKGSQYSIEIKYSYDLFDSDGYFLQSFDNPIDGMRIEFIDSNGYAYATGSPDGWPQVAKYAISLEEKTQK